MTFMQVKAVLFGILALVSAIFMCQTAEVRARKIQLMILSFAIGILASNPFFGD